MNDGGEEEGRDDRCFIPNNDCKSPGGLLLRREALAETSLLELFIKLGITPLPMIVAMGHG